MLAFIAVIVVFLVLDGMFERWCKHAYAQIPVAEWDEVKRRALMLDLGNGGTFTSQELLVLKRLAQQTFTMEPHPTWGLATKSEPGDLLEDLVGIGSSSQTRPRQSFQRQFH